MSIDQTFAPATPALQMQERRTFGRRKTFQPARIIRDGWPPAACFIVDISEGGARIRLTQAGEDFSSFELEIESQGIGISCIVAHRQPNEIGVRFARMPRQLSRTGFRAAGRLKDLVDALAANGHVPIESRRTI